MLPLRALMRVGYQTAEVKKIKHRTELLLKNRTW